MSAVMTATKRVRDLMVTEVYSLTAEDSLGEAKELMWEYNVRHVPIVDEDLELVGLVSHRDLIGATNDVESELPLSTQKDLLSGRRLEDVMTEDVATVDPDMSLQEAAQIMLENKFGCLPVVNGSRLVGILTEADFVRLAADG